MAPILSDCISLSRRLANYEELPYATVERTLWMLIVAEMLITAFSIVALVPVRDCSEKKDESPGYKIHRSLRRAPVVVGLLLAHIELLNAFFTLDERHSAMSILPEELEACPQLMRSTVIATDKLHVSKTDTPGAKMIIAFVCACIAGVLLIKFVASTFDEKQIYDDIAAEYHASYDFDVPDKVALPEKVHVVKTYKLPNTRPSNDIV